MSVMTSPRRVVIGRWIRPRTAALLATSIAGIVLAYLLVSGQWQIAVLLLSALPGVVLMHRLPFAAVIAWLLLTPFLLHTTTPAERQMYWLVHRAMPPVTLGIILVSNALHVNRWSLPRVGLPEAAMGGYLGLSLISIGFQNPDPIPSLYNLYDRVFVPMCLYLIARLSRFGDGEMRWLVAVALFLVVTQSTIGILSWIAPGLLPEVWLDKAGARTVGSLVNTSIYTTTLVFSGLLLLHVAQNSRARLIPTLFRLLFVLAMYCVALSLSRASWMAGALVLAGTLYVYPRFTSRLLIASFTAVVLLGGTVLADQLARVEARLYSEEAERSALSRLPVSYAAYRMFESSPIFGWGYGTFDLYDRAFYDQVLNLPNDQKDHASHNSYLTIIAEQGMTGLLLFLAPMLWLLSLTVRRLQSLPAEGLWSRKLVIFLWLTVLSHVVVNNFANMQVVFGLGLWWIILGLMAQLLNASGSPPAGDRATLDSRPGAAR